MIKFSIGGAPLQQKKSGCGSRKKKRFNAIFTLICSNHTKIQPTGASVPIEYKQIRRAGYLTRNYFIEGDVRRGNFPSICTLHQGMGITAAVHQPEQPQNNYHEASRCGITSEQPHGCNQSHNSTEVDANVTSTSTANSGKTLRPRLAASKYTSIPTVLKGLRCILN